MQLDQSAPIRGVFSSQEVRKVGTGTTTRKTVQKIFWFVEQEDDVLMMQSINLNFIPTGQKRPVTLEELLTKYSPEPEFYVQSVYPKMQEIKEGTLKGDSHREKGKNFSAELEYGTVLTLDEDNVRANFGIALTYLARGEVDKADNIFERLVTLEATYEPKHKHLFNEFGINLRKNEMFNQAIEYYGRALTLTKHDDNLHINMARALFEGQEMGRCVEHLLISLSINSSNEIARKFMLWLRERKFIPEEMQTHVTKVLAGEKYQKFVEEAQEEAQEKAQEELQGEAQKEPQKEPQEEPHGEAKKEPQGEAQEEAAKAPPA